MEWLKAHKWWILGAVVVIFFLFRTKAQGLLMAVKNKATGASPPGQSFGDAVASAEADAGAGGGWDTAPEGSVPSDPVAVADATHTATMGQREQAARGMGPVSDGTEDDGSYGQDEAQDAGTDGVPTASRPTSAAAHGGGKASAGGNKKIKFGKGPQRAR